MSVACDEGAAPGLQSWEEFELASRIDADVPGQYVVEEDITISGEDRLRRFYEGSVAPRAFLSADAVSHLLEPLDSETRLNYSYCVASAGPNAFANHAQIVTLMKEATDRWERATDVNFVYRPEFDANCVDGTSGVYIAVVRTDELNICGRGAYPGNPPAFRKLELRIAASCSLLAFNITHEIGHTLGFGHEFAHVDCDDQTPSGSVVLSEFDPWSVMGYTGNCGGTPLSSLSRRDVAAARAAYAGTKDAWKHLGASQVTDFNQDGKKDIYWYRTEPTAPPMTPPDAILLGGLAPTFKTSLKSLPGNFLRPQVGDYNHDGRSDVFAVDTGASAETLFVKQAGNDDDFTVSAPLTILSFVQPLTGYFNTQNETAPTPDVLFYGPGPLMDYTYAAAPAAPSGFVNVLPLFTGLGMGSPSQYLTAIVGDFDGNDATDIFYFNSDSNNSVTDPSYYISNSDGLGFAGKTFQHVDHHAMGVAGGPNAQFFYSTVRADVDGDDDDDVVFYAPGQPVVFFFGGASGPGTTVTTVANPDAAASYRPFAGDFDGDGDADLYWLNQAAAASDKVWWMSGNGAAFIASTVTANAPAHHERLPLQGDYTGDGMEDILWWHPFTGQLELWLKGNGLTFDVNAIAGTQRGYPVGFGFQ